MRIRAFNLETRSPDDVEGVRRLLDDGTIRAHDVVAVIGKTEGNGGRNDFTRALAILAFEQLLAPRLGIEPAAVHDRVVLSFSGGTEGVVTPHVIVLVREGTALVEPRPVKRLAVGIGHTRPFRPEEIGRMPQVEETARVVAEIAGTLGLASLADVHLVQLKGAIPPVSPADAEAAERSGTPLRCDMVGSRGASALGVALALGEIDAAALSDAAIGRDWSLFSSVASCSAKPGLVRTEVVVFANSPRWTGDLVVAHGVLRDILDVDGIRAVAGRLGLSIPVTDPATGPHGDPSSPLVAVFAKSEADPRGTVRGRRHTMLVDDDIGDTRYSRCVLASVLAATLGDTRVYVSTRAEHHGPLGGGPLSIIARVGEDDAA